ncbi:MAG: sulfur carrier protein ThiS [Desulfoarculaceae bacterium]|nr:sulfur carrier protein ThiS [Desulfoarculaceae bacterium]
MLIYLNGSPKTITDSKTVAGLLQDLAIPHALVVVELNKTILHPDSHAATVLKDNDQMEIIRFVGGG